MSSMSMDGVRGLATQHISKELQTWCEAAHTAFLANHNLDYWHITVVGFGLRAVSVTSEAPSGDIFGPKKMEVTTRFGQEFRSLLESHYRQYKVI